MLPDSTACGVGFCSCPSDGRSSSSFREGSKPIVHHMELDTSSALSRASSFCAHQTQPRPTCRPAISQICSPATRSRHGRTAQTRRRRICELEEHIHAKTNIIARVLIYDITYSRIRSNQDRRP